MINRVVQNIRTSQQSFLSVDPSVVNCCKSLAGSFLGLHKTRKKHDPALVNFVSTNTEAAHFMKAQYHIREVIVAGNLFFSYTSKYGACSSEGGAYFERKETQNNF